MCKGNILSRLLNQVEISQKWLLTNLKYQEAAFYARLFDEYEGGHFEVPPGRKKVGVIIKPVPGALKLYFLRKEIFLVCYVHYRLNFSLLVKKLYRIVLYMLLYPFLNKSTG